jgi:hypothetical protein
VISRCLRILPVVALLTTAACAAGPPIHYEPDVVDVTLPAPADQVKTAVIQVLTDGGYDVEEIENDEDAVERENDHTLTTGYREEIRSPWDWLLRRRFGTGRSRVDARVTPADDQTTRLRLHVLYEGKDGIFTRWEESPTALPQSAENQLRLIKNALQIL